MKTLKLAAVVGLALLIAQTASAVTVPTIGLGPVYGEGNNRDNGTGYVPGPGVVLPITFNPQVAIPAGITRIGAPGAFPDEDTWGVITFQLLREGFIAGPNNIANQLGGDVYYRWSDNPNETVIVGKFWGGQDTQVTISNVDPTGIISFSVEVSNTQLEVWAVERSQLGNSIALGASYPVDETGTAYSPERRIAQDRYAGWMEDQYLAAGTAVPLLYGESTYFRFEGTLLPNGTFAGSTDVYVNYDPDLAGYQWNPTWGMYEFYTDPNGNAADMFFSWTLSEGTAGWTTDSNDDMGVYVIPEPVTIFTALIGMAGLGKYVQKRRRLA